MVNLIYILIIVNQIYCAFGCATKNRSSFNCERVNKCIDIQLSNSIPYPIFDFQRKRSIPDHEYEYEIEDEYGNSFHSDLCPKCCFYSRTNEECRPMPRLSVAEETTTVFSNLDHSQLDEEMLGPHI